MAGSLDRGRRSHVLALVLTVLLVAGCNEGQDGTSPIFELTPFDPTVPLRVHADVTDGHQYVGVYRAGRIIGNAVVTVNGVGIRRGTPGCEAGDCMDFHLGRVPLAPGSPVTIEITVAGVTIEANGNLPEAPVITAPADGNLAALADSVTIAWTSATDPERFEVWMDAGFCCADLGSAPGTARELRIAASDLGTWGGSITVYAYHQGSFRGPVEPDSRMDVWSGSGSVTISR